MVAVRLEAEVELFVQNLTGHFLYPNQLENLRD